MTGKTRKRKAPDRCRAVNAQGKPCGNKPRPGSAYCRYHYREPLTVAGIAADPSMGSLELLQRCLDQAAFWEHLETARLTSQKAESEFAVLIKPDLEHFRPDSSCGTSPKLVEQLIMLLHCSGYTNVTVADGPGFAETWLENREVSVLADLAGYRYETDDGEGYDVVNLNEDCIAAKFKPGDALFGTALSRHWVEADFRICFGKNKTHEEEMFALCCHTLLAVLPFTDKIYHCYGRFSAPEIVTELLIRTPVHFSLIDATMSNHGSDGIRSENPLPTGAVIGSRSLLLADMVGAIKMGLDPYASRLNAHALRVIGLPAKYRIDGDLSVWPGWKNVPPLLADSVRKRNRSLLLRKTVQPWTQSVDTGYFPFKREIDERVNAAITPLFCGVDDHPFKLLSTVFSNYLLAQGGQAIETYRILYNKEKLYRRTTSIGIDRAGISENDFTCIPEYIEPFETITSQAPIDKNGLRWLSMDHSVVIEYRRKLPFPFREFVRRVDIAAAVRMMNDNIGGAVVPVKKDGKGRIVHQIERDIYLPQPNWMALFGGDFIDVTKLEFIRRTTREQTIYWKTSCSVNASARFDDGMVRFVRSGDNEVSVIIVARQDFTLPLIWQMFNIDLMPHVKNPLVSDAYLTYFSRTIANYEATFQGRDVRTGKEFSDSFGELDGQESTPFPGALLKKIMEAAPVADIIRQVIEKGPAALSDIGTSDGRISPLVQSAISAVSGTVSDVFDAVRKDLNELYNKESGVS